MYYFSSEALTNLFSPNEVIDIVEDGIRKHAEGKYNVPERMHINRGESTNLIMPAFGEQYYCTKLISVDPQNHINNLPIISGILVLNNSHSGKTLATMDAPMITALRTAAIGSIGLNLICDDGVKTLGIIGLGVQGYWQTIFAASIRNISKIFCYSRSKSKFYSYQKKVTERFPNITTQWCSTAEKVVQNAEVIISCTTSKKPVFKTVGLNISSKRFISVGSFARDMQEFPSEVYRQVDAMIIDSKSAETEVGDVINSIKNNWIQHSNIFTLADILIGKKSIGKHSKIVFKSVGMAAFDLALAVSVYKHKLPEINTNNGIHSPKL